MFSKLALAGALAIPLGLFALSATVKAEDSWNPSSSYNPKMTIKLYPDTVHHAVLRHAMAAAPASAPAIHHAMLTCDAASRIVRRDGFDHVVARNCGGRTFVFRAERHGHPVMVDVNPHNGHAWVG